MHHGKYNTHACVKSLIQRKTAFMSITSTKTYSRRQKKVNVCNCNYAVITNYITL